MPTLICLVQGEFTTNAFAVDIDANKTVSHLRDIIKEKKTIDFCNVDADGLVLWRVNVPADDDSALRALVLVEDETRGITMMQPTWDIIDVFPSQPPKRHIHVIIEVPSRT